VRDFISRIYGLALALGGPGLFAVAFLDIDMYVAAKSFAEAVLDRVHQKFVEDEGDLGCLRGVEMDVVATNFKVDLTIGEHERNLLMLDERFGDGTQSYVIEIFSAEEIVDR